MRPLIELHDLRKVFGHGQARVEALRGIDLRIWPGEFVAIVGASGSGKSTLMYLLGCLDRPSQGIYRFRGEDVATVSANERARLRREHFGFVFQTYHLVATVDAQHNVEMPALYTGLDAVARRKRAGALLRRLGLADRSDHRPGALSGGQQQRVSIARALMNGGEVILADEPTGALDQTTGREVLALLRQLNHDGHTVILITHDPDVAAIADRRIEIVDGRIRSDTGEVKRQSGLGDRSRKDRPAPDGGFGLPAAGLTAFASLHAKLVRTLLTLLGIVIGVAAVIVMLAIGDGARQEVVSRIEAMGSDLLVVRPGAPNQRGTGGTATLVPGDAEAIASLAMVRAAAPEMTGNVTLRAEDVDVRTSLLATSADYAAVHNWSSAQGTFLRAEDIETYAPVVVLGETVANALFTDAVDPVGEWVLAGQVPLQVIGVLEAKGATSWGSDRDDVAIVPLSTGQLRLIGQRHLRSISVQVAEVERIDIAEAAVDRLLLERHGTRDFSIRNMAALIDTVAATQQTLTLLLGAIAAVSLLVGGIGVMNIMLVSVSERTREIGIRMATGARPGDILTQFLVESLLVCAFGAAIGVVFGLGTVSIIDGLGTPVLFSLPPVLGAVACALVIGLVFGLMPARRAARLDPVRALTAE